MTSIGHNHPPADLPYDPDILAECIRDVTEFTLAAGLWLDLGEIETKEQSGKATDFVAGARIVFKRVDDRRKAAKQPHDEAGKAVQAAFAPLLEKMTKTADAVKAMQARWLRAEQVREDARRAAALAEAAKAREEAEKAAAEAAARNDISGQVDADAALKAAEKAEKSASREASVKAGSATGGGRSMSLRQTYRCDLTAMSQAILHYRNHPDLAELLVRLAEAEVRGQKGEKIAPPGFTIRIEETAA